MLSTEGRTARALIVAGEASGDLYGAALVRALGEQAPGLEFVGIGGAEMEKAGVRLLARSAQLGVVGYVELAGSLRYIAEAYWRARGVLRAERPALAIFIDYPDFNLRLCRVARGAGVPVLYYISPQVWAWRRWRVRTIARVVDRMLVAFPFEVPFYQQAGVPVEFVGHPLLDLAVPTLSREDFFRTVGLDPSRPLLALAPGSRRAEVARLLPLVAEAARRLQVRDPHLQVLVAPASTVDPQQLQQAVAASALEARVIAGCTYDILAHADAAIVASGTVTLEAALLGVPMVVVYRLSPLTYGLVRPFIHVRHIALPNLIAGRRVVPELIQGAATPGRLAAATARLLDDPEARTAMRKDLGTVRGALGGPGATARAAAAARTMLRIG
ncbi:MAG: lipid-A-disaccharide synthase [Deltaproteobacteria bacterium]|nr:lipid-A-disaccharide synthase [Deltaproteobacteria bacterium]MBI3077796.1 lipid-A-disaccharide synthase [Deltaproteobacteria bacterium]